MNMTIQLRWFRTRYYKRLYLQWWRMSTWGSVYSEQADALCHTMNRIWDRMTEPERNYAYRVLP